MSTSFESPAWQLIGTTRTKPGYLIKDEDRLIFEVEGKKVFNAPMSEITDIVFPWYYFGGGVKMSVRTTNYRFSFVKPNGSMDPISRGKTGVQSIMSIGSGRKAGKAWKEALT